MGIKNIIEKEESLQARPKSIKQMLKSVVANQQMQANAFTAAKGGVNLDVNDPKLQDAAQEYAEQKAVEEKRSEDTAKAQQCRT